MADDQQPSADYWRKRWLHAIEQLDEEAVQRISLRARAEQLEALAADMPGPAPIPGVTLALFSP